jgi:hypothetical protein
MTMHRRQFLGTATLVGVAAALPAPVLAADTASLPNLAAKAVPIGKAERAARIAKAKELMRANDIGALLIEPGSSLIYFTGVEWWRSERLTAAVLTREGEVAIVTPFFEEPSVRESLGIDAEVLTWNEDENPLGRGRRMARQARAGQGPHRRRGNGALFRGRRAGKGDARRDGRSMARPLCADAGCISRPPKSR